MRPPVCAFFIKTTVRQEGRKLFVVVSDDKLEFHFWVWQLLLSPSCHSLRLLLEGSFPFSRPRKF
jgi:hypothetical protein